ARHRATRGAREAPPPGAPRQRKLQRRTRPPRRRAEGTPVDPVPPHERPEVLAGDLRVQGGVLDAAVVAAELGEDVEALEIPEGAQPRLPEDQVALLRRRLRAPPRPLEGELR